MFRERIILNTKYSHGGQTGELLRNVNEISVRQGAPKACILQSVSGRQMTYVFERDFESFDDFFDAHNKLVNSEEFRQWFPDFQAAMDHGAQEYYTIIDR